MSVSASQTSTLEQAASGSASIKAGAEEWPQHVDIVGMVNQGRLALSCITRLSWNNANPRERCGTVQREVWMVEEEDRHARALAMKQQGSWTRWDSV